MSVILISKIHPPELWVPALRRLLPEETVRAHPNDVGDPGEVEIAVVQRPPPGLLRSFPRLKAIIGLFAGVEAIVGDPDLPDVPLARMVDPMLARDVAHYVVLHTLRHYRSMDRLQANQRARFWEADMPPPPLDFEVGIMGLGTIGALAGRMLADLGFTVRGWSRTAKTIDRVHCFHGGDGLAPFLARAQVLAMVLPLTPETTGIVNHKTLGQLPKGAYVINAGRGASVVGGDLLAAIDADHIAGATLDVFSPEPPPPESPFWTHPKITVTPHNAGDPRPESVAPVVAENIRRVRAGQPMLHLVDRKRGY